MLLPELETEKREKSAVSFSHSRNSLRMSDVSAQIFIKSDRPERMNSKYAKERSQHIALGGRFLAHEKHLLYGSR